MTTIALNPNAVSSTIIAPPTFVQVDGRIGISIVLVTQLVKEPNAMVVLAISQIAHNMIVVRRTLIVIWVDWNRLDPGFLGMRLLLSHAHLIGNVKIFVVRILHAIKTNVAPN
jgi:hypothetical protein